MTKTRAKHSTAFKTKVALAAIRISALVCFHSRAVASAMSFTVAWWLSSRSTNDSRTLTQPSASFP